MSKDASIRKGTKSTIHIVTVTNNTYVEPLAVMLNSILENKVSANPIEIYIIASELSAENKSFLAQTVAKFNLKIKFISLDPAIYDNFKTVKYLTKETYYRYSIPDLLEQSIQKVIYLDSDIIVKRDITWLWNVNIDDYCLAAVVDYCVRDSRNSHLSIPKGSKYFNAGVLLINLEKWRAQDIKNKVIEFARANSEKVKFCSQDPLNAILHDKWLELNPKWNYFPQYLRFSELKTIKPAIIHYAGPSKPWEANCLLRNEYLKYRRNVCPCPLPEHV